MRYKIISTLIVVGVMALIGFHETKEIFWEVKPLLLAILALAYINIIKETE